MRSETWQLIIRIVPTRHAYSPSTVSPPFLLSIYSTSSLLSPPPIHPSIDTSIDSLTHTSIHPSIDTFTHSYIHSSFPLPLSLPSPRVLTSSGATVVENWLWTMVNVGCQLAGYYAAALTIDRKFFGRVRMQVGYQNQNRDYDTSFSCQSSIHVGQQINFVLPNCFVDRLYGNVKVFKPMMQSMFFHDFWDSIRQV